MTENLEGNRFADTSRIYSQSLGEKPDEPPEPEVEPIDAEFVLPQFRRPEPVEPPISERPDRHLDRKPRTNKSRRYRKGL